MVDSHHKLFKDFDPLEKMEAMGGATYFKLRCDSRSSK